MYIRSFARFSRLFASFFVFLLIFSSVAAARPVNPFLLEAQKEKKKLPPVNYIRSRNVDVQHIDINLLFDWDKEQAYGVSTVTLIPFHDLDTFTLDAAKMTINSVKLVGGGALKFQYDIEKENDNLEINLGRTYKPGEKIVVAIDYRTNYVNKVENSAGILGFGRGLRFIKPTADEPDKPKQIWSQGESEFNRYWFPGYDSPNDFRTTELHATVQKPFVVISNGKLVTVKDNLNGTRTFNWKMDQPYSNYLTSIVVGEYAEVKGAYAGVPVSSFVYKNEYAAGAATTKNLPATVQFFSEKTGVKYPYPKYSQTMVEDFGGGMENITATTQITEMIHDSRELLDGDSEGLQSHELAHQWFGDYVTCRDWGQIWLNESFATYFQALWDEQLKGKDVFLYEDVRNNQDQYLGTWNQGNRRPIVTKFYADKDALFDNYAYPRGGAVLHMLRKHLGDAAWWKAINHYLTANAHQPVSTEDFRIAIEESTGQSMDWFFDQWLYKMGHPIFEITQNYDDTKKQLTLNVKQTQQIDPDDEYPQVDYFQTKVDIEIDNKIEQVWVKPQAENTFTFNVASKPRLVNFDYQSTLIKELKFDKSVEELLYQMQNDKDPLGRNWAMQQLVARSPMAPGTGADPIRPALLSMAEKDLFWHNRLDALNAYRLRLVPEDTKDAIKLDDTTVQALLRLVKAKEAQIRSAAVSFLGVTHDQRHADLYVSLLNDQTQSYNVVDEAANGLGKTKSPKAYDTLTKLTTIASWHNRIAAAGMSGLAELNDSRSFDMAYKIATDKSIDPALRTAALAVVGSTGKGDPRAYPLIADSFKKALASNSFQGMFNAIQAVIKLGDPRGQEVFDLVKERYKNSANALRFIGQLEEEFKKSLNK
jgi:aminopeptidase N